MTSGGIAGASPTSSSSRPVAPGFVLLEVKGPGDRLRPEQVAWLDYLDANGLPCTVLAVEWSTATSGTRFAAVESSE